MSKFEVLPNPLSDNGKVILSGRNLDANDIQVRVFDLRGQELSGVAYPENAGFNANQLTYMLNTSQLGPGAYVLSVNDGKAVASEVFTVVR